MIFPQAITAGLAGEQLSRRITGTDEVSAGRSAVATGAGAIIGGAAAAGLGTAATAAGLTAAATIAAPVVLPVAIVSGAVALIRSLWD